jgi:hypothetical protein
VPKLSSKGSTSQTVSDVATDVTPVVSTVKDGCGCLTGQNMITGEEIGTGERAVRCTIAVIDIAAYVGAIFSEGGTAVGEQAAKGAIRAWLERLFKIGGKKLAEEGAEAVAKGFAKMGEKELAEALAKMGEKELKELAEQAAKAGEKELSEKVLKELAERGPGKFTSVPVTIGKQEHTITARRVGDRFELWLCSDGCGPLIERSQALLAKLTDDAARSEVEAVIKRAELIEKRLKAGKLTAEEAEQEIARLGRRLDRAATREPAAVSEVVERVRPSELDPPGTEYKKPVPGLTGKEAATDIPSWVKSEGYPTPRLGETGEDYATRILNHKYGEGNWKRGADTEFSKIQKWADRHFE